MNTTQLSPEAKQAAAINMIDKAYNEYMERQLKKSMNTSTEKLQEEWAAEMKQMVDEATCTHIINTPYYYDKSSQPDVIGYAGDVKPRGEVTKVKLKRAKAWGHIMLWDKDDSAHRPTMEKEVDEPANMNVLMGELPSEAISDMSVVLDQSEDITPARIVQFAQSVMETQRSQTAENGVVVLGSLRMKGKRYEAAMVYCAENLKQSMPAADDTPLYALDEDSVTTSNGNVYGGNAININFNPNPAVPGTITP